MNKKSTAWLILALACASALGLAQADTLYVTDRILLGVHQDPAEESPVLKTIPSGTGVEVLQRKDDFAQVRTDDGTTGWVNAGYLMSEQPARLLLDSLNAKQQKQQLQVAQLTDQLQVKDKELKDQQQALSDLTAKLKALQEQKPAPAANGKPADTQALAKAEAEIKDLQAKLQAAQAAQPKADKPETTTSQADPDAVEKLRRDNLELRARIEVARANLNGDKVPSPAELVSVQPAMPSWYAGLLGVVLIVGFIGGVMFFDYRYRKRHGGFRL